MRTAHSELPDSQELETILDREAKRPIPLEKDNVHFVQFGSCQELLTAYGVSLELFTLTDFSFEQGHLELAEEELNELVRRIVSQEPSAEQHAALNTAYDYLAEQDEVTHADLIFIFGSKQHFRIDKAVELYASGVAPLVVISGNRTHYENGDKPEALSLKEYALQKGIPEEKVITETASISLPDNVRSSLNLLDDRHISYTRIVLVNSPFAQRRGWAYFSKFSPAGTEFVRVNADTSEAFSRNGWYKNAESTKIVLNEYVKMRLGVLLNSL